MDGTSTEQKPLFSAFRANPPPARRWAPKVRTGCVACKQARIKCQEGKPKCRRCTKRKIDCCYQIPKPWIFDYKPTQDVAANTMEDQHLRASRIATESCSASSPPSRGKSEGKITPKDWTTREDEALVESYPHLSLRPHVSYHSNRQHMAALQYFMEVLSRHLAYNKAPSLFTVVIPQAAIDSATVGEALVALTTLWATRKGISTTTWTRNPAYYHYNQAIRKVAGSRPTRQMILLVCMVLWLFDQINNDHTRASLHRKSASKLLIEWRCRDFGHDRVGDEYIASNLEPAFLLGFKITAPPKFCREVLSSLQQLLNNKTPIAVEDNYEETLSSLRSCIASFVIRSGEAVREANGVIYAGALFGLQMWDYQFRHYSGINWNQHGPILLLYATTVALLIRKEVLVRYAEDADWYRVFEFFREETEQIRADPQEVDKHALLLQGIALVVP